MQEGLASDLRRVHWRLRVALLVVALGSALLSCLALRPVLVLGASVACLAVWGYSDRSALRVVPLLHGWRAAATAAGIAHLSTTPSTKGPRLIAPTLGRVWMSEDVVLLEYVPWRERLADFDVTKLANHLGFVSGRVRSTRHTWRGSRVQIELRRSRALPMRELQMPELSEWNRAWPVLAEPELPAGGTVTPGVICPQCAEVDGSSREHPRRALIVKHLPHECWTHYVWWEPGDAVGSWSTSYAGVPNKLRGQRCDAFAERGRDVRTQPVTADEVAVLAANPPRMKPRDARGLPAMDDSYASHEACVNHFRKRLEDWRTVIPKPVPTAQPSWREVLDSINIGASLGGRPWQLRLVDSHTLVAGETGSGKSGVIWAMIAGMAPAAAAGVIQLWGLDPKRTELAAGRDIFDEYACEVGPMVELLERAVQRMTTRADLLAERRQRRFEPSPRSALIVIVIEELGYLTLLAESTGRELAGRYEIALTTLLTQGRALGFSLIAGVQDARKKAVDTRDLWPTRVAMRMPNSQAELILGAGSTAAGALTEAIPVNARGTGYVRDDQVPGEMREVRAAWVSDEAIAQVEAAVVVWRQRRTEAIAHVVQAPAVGGVSDSRSVDSGTSPSLRSGEAA